MKPNFIIAGERRSGTSTLAKWIEVHPEIYLHPPLDKAFFLDDSLRGRLEWLDGNVDTHDWDNSHSKIDYESIFEEANTKHKAVGEKSADYFFWEPSMLRINEMYPDMKIVLTFRNPINRAWSHYWNEVGKGRESLSFEEAIAKEQERIENSDYAKVHLSYTERGKYSKSLAKLLSIKKTEDIHIIIFEDLIISPELTLKNLYKFLGLNQELGMDRVGKRYNHNWTTVPYAFWTKNEFRKSIEIKINRVIRRVVTIFYKDMYQIRKVRPKWEKITRKPQKDFKMNSETREMLISYYEPFIKELEQMLNKDLNYWRK